MVRRELFRLPIRWHSGNLDQVWSSEERRIERLIDRAARNEHIDWFTVADRGLRTSSLMCRRGVSETRELARRLWLAARGSEPAKRWLSWRINVLWRRLQGHTTHPPRPEVP